MIDDDDDDNELRLAAVYTLCADGHFPFGATTCVVWATMDVLMCTASIWHMATISVDRYCSLRFPLRYRRTRTPFFVIAKIAFVWIVSIGICSPLAVAGFINPFTVYHHGDKCAPAVPQFVIYGSIFAFYVPLVLMIVSYALTVKTLTKQAIWRRQECKRSQDANAHHDAGDAHYVAATKKSPPVEVQQPDGESAAEPPPRTSSTAALDSVSLDRAAGTEKVEDARVNGKSSCDGTELQLRRRDDLVETHSNGDCVLSATSRPAPPSTRHNDNSDGDDRQRRHIAFCRRNTEEEERRNHKTGDHDDNKVASQNHLNSHRAGETFPPSDMPTYCAVPRHSSKARQQSFSTKTRLRKRKATRVLGVIFTVFLVLWTPFFVLNILSAVCPRCVESVEPNVYTVLVWLGWISSFANPIIYTSFSPAFRSTFKRLLTCHCEHRMTLAERRQQQWTSLMRNRSRRKRAGSHTSQ